MNILQTKTARSWIEVDLDALEFNIQELTKQIHPSTHFMAVVKADAYGHGAITIAKELEKMGIHYMATATLDEAISLRQNDIHSHILILGYTATHLAPLLQKYCLTQSVIDYNYGKQLNAMNIPISVHIKIDSGMHRLGQDYHDISHIQKLFELPNLHVTGIFSHLCAADSQKEEDIAYTIQQFQHFNSTIYQLKSMGYDIGLAHIQSSYGLMNYLEYHYDLVRIGIAMYGVKSSRQDIIKHPLDLHPVLSLRSRIACLHHYPQYSSIGYGRNYVLGRDSVIAVVPIGYADGLPRQLSSYQFVLVKGKKAPIIGKICMDQLMIDVTDIIDVSLNDIVTIIGKDKNEMIHIEDIADNAQTISNEILSRIGQRLVKVYIKKGTLIHEKIQTSIL